jgi:hypothetical protein
MSFARSVNLEMLAPHKQNPGYFGDAQQFWQIAQIWGFSTVSLAQLAVT